MPSSEEFTNKIKELSLEEIEYTEDFFKKAFGESTDAPTHVELKKTANTANRNNITSHFSDEDIDDEWLAENPESFDGQLAVDVFQTENEIIISSTVAGVKAEDLDIAMNGDMITIRGHRQQKFSDVPPEDFFIKECYWGGFSRSIILPLDIQHDQISATLEHGVLTIILPKSHASRNGRIEVIDLSM